MGADNYVTKAQLLKKYNAFKVEWAKWFYRSSKNDNFKWEIVKVSESDGAVWDHVKGFNEYQHGLDEFDKLRGAASITATLNVY